MTKIECPEPKKITLIDGKEREFALSRAGLDRLKKTLGVDSAQEILNLPAEKVMARLLIEAQTGEKDLAKLSEAEFAEILPIDIDWCGEVAAALFGIPIPAKRSA